MLSIADIKARYSLAELVRASGVSMRMSGALLSGRCPFHDDRTPSFFVNPQTERWRCFGRCDAANGHWLDVIDFAGWRLYGSAWNARDREMFKAALRELTGDSYANAQRSTPVVATRQPAPRRDALTRDHALLLDRAAALYRLRLGRSASAETPLEYLHRRGFQDDSIQRSGIGYCDGSQLLKYLLQTGAPIALARVLHLVDEERGDREFMRGRIVFPDFDTSGAVTHLVGRKWAPFLGKRAPKYLSMKGQGKPLFGWGRQDKRESERPVFVTESLTDWLTLLQWGLAAVAVLGTAMGAAYAHQLSSLPRPIIYLPHNDQAGTGLEAAWQWQQQVGRGLVLPLPTRVGGQPIKDANDLATAPGGKEAFFTELSKRIARGSDEDLQLDIYAILIGDKELNHDDPR